jgi:hypothetical protein
MRVAAAFQMNTDDSAALGIPAYQVLVELVRIAGDELR